MYVSSVNRGVSFTKAGFYTTGFVMVLGFVATGSGYNGLFLALGYGLSVLTISGLLSERVMKHYELLGLADVMAEPNVPFSVLCVARNKSPDIHLFGIENIFVTTLPRISVMPSAIPALIECRELMLQPGERREIPGTCRGLARGVYREFHVIQRTLYPFGLLNKYKLGRISSKITVPPAFLEELGRELMAEFQRRIHGNLEEQNFHSHRPLTDRDPIRLVDWKKSAGLEVRDWSLKVYESPLREFSVVVEPDWLSLRLAPDEASYERSLAVVRTACEVVHRGGRKLLLRAPDGGAYDGHEASLEALARAPSFVTRDNLATELTGEGAPPARAVKLRVTGEDWRWEVPQGG